ncbi:MAG: hypothetical protein KAS96_12840 [Planctomycetes bacterium]|nr:hypothetical protein [Planctomycetota bacterium]
MKTLRNIFVMVVMLVSVGNVLGDAVYTAGATNNFVDYVATHGPNGVYPATNTYYCATPTLDWVPPVYEVTDMYFIGISRFNGGIYLNVAGRTWGEWLTLWTYGDSVTLPVLELYVIIDNGDENLFSVNSSTGQLTIGLAGEGAFLGNDDIVLSSTSISIDEGVFGDISAIGYSPGQEGIFFDNFDVVTPPVTIDSPKNGTVGIDPNTSLIWEGDAGSEFNVHLYDNKGGPVYVFPGLTDTSLDVNGYLDWKTTYNWQVDEVIGGEVTYSSPVWTFTTIDYECQSVLVGDWNGDCVVNFVDFAMMSDNWLDEVPKVPEGSGG